jgi:hypothetical protein
MLVKWFPASFPNLATLGVAFRTAACIMRSLLTRRFKPFAQLLTLDRVLATPNLSEKSTIEQIRWCMTLMWSFPCAPIFYIFLYSHWMWGIFHVILSVRQNIVMTLNNDMSGNKYPKWQCVLKRDITLHSKLRSEHIYGNQSAHDVTECCGVNMDAWYYGVSVACDILE